MSIYCTYITFYRGNKLPPFYIGSTSVEKINNGYRGSVASKRWKSIYKIELKNNPHLFSIEIIETFENRKYALNHELELQIANNVVKSKWFFNESLASVNGFFGMNKTGIKRTLEQNIENSNRNILRSINNAGFTDLIDAKNKIYPYIQKFYTVKAIRNLFKLSNYIISIIFPEVKTNEYKKKSKAIIMMSESYKQNMSYSLSKFIGPKIPKYFRAAKNSNLEIIGYIHKDDPRWDTGEIISSLNGIENKFKNMPFWNNGVNDVRSEICPGPGYILGRKPFNNNGAYIGAEVNKQKIWVTNGVDELYVYKNQIPEEYIKGRSNSIKKDISAAAKKREPVKWINSGTIEKMIPITEDIPEGFKPGRLSSVMNIINSNRGGL